ncbi:hypothetical protein DRI50_07655 [candidate division KSB1 bacterium]|nr:MAG: hypothetical protein DRI50_07655 [candidate division KSB1 bacterium]
MNRRKFLKKSVLFSSTFWLPRLLLAKNSLPDFKKSRVVIARDTKIFKHNHVDSDRVLGLLDLAMQNYFDVNTPLRAWRKIVHPGEVIGIKVNCLSGRGSTHHELVNAVLERLLQAGIRAMDIIIWDRLNKDLEEGGFHINYDGKGPRIFGNDAVGFAPNLYVFGQAGSLLTRTITNLCDGVINIGLLRDHSIAGVSISLKNLFGAIHNPNKYHLNVGDPYIADVNAFSVIRQKVRFSIVDALEAQYHGGPAYMPQWRWKFGGLIVGQDRVAIDYTGWRIIEAKRKAMGKKSLRDEGREPTYIFTAADGEHALGHCNPKLIETIRVKAG